MSDHSGKIVRTFLNRWNLGIDEIKAAFRDTFAEQGVWNNVGLLITTGPEEAIKALDNFVAQMGFVRMGHDMTNFVTDGGRVYTERVDRFFNAEGREILAVPVFGVFELDREDKISQWRDYFDSKILA